MTDRLPNLPTPRGTDTDDWRLMREIAAGSEDAFRDLIGRYQDVLLHLFARLGARHDEADDAAQETFLRVHAYRQRYRPTGSFRTFLFTVARRAWLDLCRRRERRRRREASGYDLEAMERSVGVGLDQRLDLEAALQKLSEGHRMVLVLSIWGGLKYEEIADVMDIPEGTVKSRVFHALRKLRARLSRARVS
ncbi:MAG: sigma-70 family RNA polymerase sigma factor [Planctomycetes bacterium]|nr:sigma-70 family RNA polymerase sigma factor [Planctomycetota bacterium]